ncbi:polysaccharide lyase [Oleiharenicola lentus]|uniref:polysaccharide lyase n=1 Tax=Oleiharenicola lentus TaxID=2508720 RepID=UPI003F66A89B
MKTRFVSCLLASAAFCTATSVSLAVASFHNTGTTANGGGFSNWDGSNLDANCSITQSTSTAYGGSGTSIKAQAIYNSGYSGRYHAMKTRNNGYTLGETGFYGFAFYLQAAWDFSGSQQYQLFQFIANYNGSSCGEDWQPSAMVWIAGNKLASRRNFGPSACSRTTVSYTNLATVTAGVWHRIVIQARWTNDSTGFYKLWYDGSKVLELLSQPTTINDGRQYRMDVGLYANSWKDQGYATGSTNRQLWIDKVGKGTVFADADPAQW